MAHHRRQINDWLNVTVQVQYSANFVSNGSYVVVLTLYSTSYCAPEGALFYDAVDIGTTTFYEDVSESGKQISNLQFALRSSVILWDTVEFLKL